MDSFTPGGGLDLSECDRVHLLVGYTDGMSQKEKMERGKKSENWHTVPLRVTGKSTKNKKQRRNKKKLAHTVRGEIRHVSNYDSQESDEVYR